MKKMVREYGDAMALIVLVYLVLKMVINLVLLSFTLLKEGPGAFLALLVALYLSNQQAFSKIRRKNRRMKKKQEHRRDQETRAMKPSEMIDDEADSDESPV